MNVMYFSLGSELYVKNIKFKYKFLRLNNLMKLTNSSQEEQFFRYLILLFIFLVAM